jgi:hypothetical protein
MGVTSQQSFNFRLIANGTQLDTFTDEIIKVSNNVTGLFDVGLLPSDFTRQITLPGSKTNNAFFEHVYDISVINPFLFATNVKVPCHIDYDGIYVSQGYLQLNKVNVTANKWIDSYEVSIFGILSSFSRDINRLFLTELTTLQKYNHTSSIQNITASWSGSLFNGDIVYPLAEYGQNIVYSPNEADFGIDSQYGGLCVQDFKPAIRMKAVWDAIFEQTGYTYESTFLNADINPWINDIYMICNYKLRYPVYSNVDIETYGLFKISPISGSGQTNLTMSAATDYKLNWYNIEKNPGNNLTSDLVWNTTYPTQVRGVLNMDFNISGSGTIVPQFYLKIKNAAGTTISNQPLGVINNYLLQVQLYNNGQTRNQNIEIAQQFNSGLLPSGSYTFNLTWSNSTGTGVTRVVMNQGNSVKSYLEVNKCTSIGDGLVMDIPSNLPFATTGIKLVDFLKGVQKKFNLVIQPSKTKLNHFEVSTFNNWYKTGKILSFDRYINLDDKIEVIPANNLAVNQLNFGDTLDQDYVSLQFSKGANREFGKQYYIDTQNFFSQGTFDVKTIFASSPLIRLAGTGQSGSVGGINPPITQYSAGTYQFTNQNGAQYACSSPVQIQIFTADGTLTSGQIAYLDQYGQSPVLGYYYFSNGTQIYSVGVSTGLIGTVAALCRR